MYQAIIFGISALLCVLSLLFFKSRDKRKFDMFLKCLTVAFCTVGFFRFLLSDSFILVINGAWYNGVYYDDIDILQSILRWGYYTSYAVLPMAVFFDSRLFKNFASYISLPFAVLSVVFFDGYMEYFLDPAGSGIHLTPVIRYIYFILELTLAISVPVIMQIGHKHFLNVKDSGEIKRLLIGAPLILVAMIPVYLPQSLFGYSVKIPPMFGNYHLIWIGVLFVLTLALYYAFRFRSYRERYMLCVFLTLLLFFHHNSLYLMGINIKRLPFQLCNIASYFYFIAMVTKSRRMFEFCFIANIVGTLIAILGPDFGIGDFSFWNVHFLIQHSLVLIVPAMVMGLRILPRLTPRSLKYLLVGFTAYFLFSFISGTILNGYADVTGERVNYFYMFDLETAFDYVPFLTFMGDYRFVIGRFEIYPLVVLTIYLGFLLLCFLFYLLVRFCYRIEDDHLELRRSGIDLYEKITHKESNRPKQFID